MSKVAFVIVISAVTSIFFACIPASRRLPNQLNEVSGAEINPTGGYYLINDSGNAAALFTLKDGKVDSSQVLNTNNYDWEALAMLGESLVICDIGDNRRRRKEIVFYLLSPDGAVETVAKSYPDKVHNAEAAYAYNGRLYLLTKAQTKSKERQKMAYLYDVELAQPQEPMRLIDSIALPNKVATGACMLDDQTLGVVAYDFDKFLVFPYTKTSVFTISLLESGGFRQNSLQEKKVRSPFTVTQYESILPGKPGEVLIFSERTLSIPARKRMINLPRK